jgi:hypothetical protein
MTSPSQAELEHSKRDSEWNIRGEHHAPKNGYILVVKSLGLGREVVCGGVMWRFCLRGKREHKTIYVFREKGCFLFAVEIYFRIKKRAISLNSQ